MNNFDKLIEQLNLIQEKFTHIDNFLTNTYIEFQQKQLEKLIAALEAKHTNMCSCACSCEHPVQFPEEDTLHSARYAAERIGISDKTVYRLTKSGMLPVHSYCNRERRFLLSDIERCRRYYRGE
ncbi:helix-turn-helix transcriptional regulator [Olivibacter domesticus]|uniref:Helix-turn-helix domain-containing protein n=1 Tax=Olivibacter domesticus TaxID=407022 RepID=A0A1H7KHJ9_OLID1|nr:helix-turn-helix domain-containing protein [Olivibacter domesticus]SEK86331.1 Helix-turn-helix domain-containing protein [Olivibacter domesticus]